MDQNISEVERMMQIIQNVMSSDSNLIQKATVDFQEACERFETVQVLYDILVTATDTHVRQYSALLLKKILAKKRRWNRLVPEQQELIKTGMLDALMQEEHDCVRKATAQVVGVLSKRCKTYMNEVWKRIYSSCSSSDPTKSELGSSIFAILADLGPDQFSPLIETVCEMLLAALVAHKDVDNMATPIIRNILCGISALIPITLAHNTAEQTLQVAVPLILKSLQAFASQPEVDSFLRSFEIFDSILQYNPKILNNYAEILTVFCMRLSSNRQLNSAVRVKALDYVGSLVEVKKKVLIKLKLIDGIIEAVFNLMVTEPEDGYYEPGDDREHPMTSATHTMNLLALNIPSEKLLPLLLALVASALKTQDPLSRRAAYMSMAVIAEGCSEAICSQYLDAFINAVREGVNDATPWVSDAAFYALGQFSEHLQPDISKFAPQIMPICLQSLQQLSTELQNDKTELKKIECIFYAIETFCQNLGDQLTPYLSTLMEILFKAIEQNNSVRVRELALDVVCAAATATEENMVPYLQPLKTILESFLVETDDVNIKMLLPRSIDSLAALARAIGGKENFEQLAGDSMRLALNLLEKIDDSEVRRALYNLIAALATVLNEEMAFIYPKIMKRIFDSIHSTKEDVMALIMHDYEQNDIEDDEEDDDMGYAGDDGVENLNLPEKEQAIFALKQFAEHTGAAFIPYLEVSFQNVYKMIDHSEEEIRKASIGALCAFVIALIEHQDIKGVTNSMTYLLPKLKDIVHDDEEITVVMAALKGIFEMLEELEEDALSSDCLRNCVFGCIEDVIQGRASCQHNESDGDEDDIGEESELEVGIIETAESILPVFGLCMTPKEFVPYFQRIFPIIVQKLRKAIELNALDSLRSSIYSCLADCFQALEDECGALFNTLCPVMLGGVSDKCDEAREWAIYGLGELVLYSKGQSYHAYPEILNALFGALSNEVKPGVVDNICGAISRVIKTNIELVPLAQVLPLYMKKLPLRKDFSQNLYVLQCLETLYEKVPDSLITTLQPVLSTITQVLFKNDDSEDETREKAKHLLIRMTTDHPELAAEIVHEYPELNTL